MILEVAAGVVLGGIVLWLLAAFAEPLLKIVFVIGAFIVGVIALIIAVAVAYEVCRGFSDLADGTPGDDVAKGLAGLSIVIAGFYLWGKISSWADKRSVPREVQELRNHDVRASEAAALPSPQPAQIEEPAAPNFIIVPHQLRYRNKP